MYLVETYITDRPLDELDLDGLVEVIGLSGCEGKSFLGVYLMVTRVQEDYFYICGLKSGLTTAFAGALVGVPRGAEARSLPNHGSILVLRRPPIPSTFRNLRLRSCARL